MNEIDNSEIIENTRKLIDRFDALKRLKPEARARVLAEIRPQLEELRKLLEEEL